MEHGNETQKCNGGIVVAKNRLGPNTILFGPNTFKMTPSLCYLRIQRGSLAWSNMQTSSQALLIIQMINNRLIIGS